MRFWFVGVALVLSARDVHASYNNASQQLDVNEVITVFSTKTLTGNSTLVPSVIYHTITVAEDPATTITGSEASQERYALQATSQSNSTTDSHRQPRTTPVMRNWNATSVSMPVKSMNLTSMAPSDRHWVNSSYPGTTVSVTIIESNNNTIFTTLSVWHTIMLPTTLTDVEISTIHEVSTTTTSKLNTMISTTTLPTTINVWSTTTMAITVVNTTTTTAREWATSTQTFTLPTTATSTIIVPTTILQLNPLRQDDHALMEIISDNATLSQLTKTNTSGAHWSDDSDAVDGTNQGGLAPVAASSTLIPSSEPDTRTIYVTSTLDVTSSPSTAENVVYSTVTVVFSHDGGLSASNTMLSSLGRGNMPLLSMPAQFIIDMEPTLTMADIPETNAPIRIPPSYQDAHANDERPSEHAPIQTVPGDIPANDRKPPMLPPVREKDNSPDRQGHSYPDNLNHKETGSSRAKGSFVELVEDDEDSDYESSDYDEDYEDGEEEFEDGEEDCGRSKGYVHRATQAMRKPLARLGSAMQSLGSRISNSVK